MVVRRGRERMATLAPVNMENTQNMESGRCKAPDPGTADANFTLQDRQT